MRVRHTPSKWPQHASTDPRGVCCTPVYITHTPPPTLRASAVPLIPSVCSQCSGSYSSPESPSEEGHPEALPFADGRGAGSPVIRTAVGRIDALLVLQRTSGVGKVCGWKGRVWETRPPQASICAPTHPPTYAPSPLTLLMRLTRSATMSGCAADTSFCSVGSCRTWNRQPSPLASEPQSSVPLGQPEELG